MSRLEIRDADDNVMSTVRVENGEIEVLPPNESLEDELANMYVVDLDSGERVTYEGNPEAWLAGLQLNFRGIYARGVLIPE